MGWPQEVVVSDSVKTVAVLTAKNGHEGDLHALLRGMVSPSRAESGNLRYDLWLDAEMPGRFVIEEMYRDAEAVAAHRATPHYLAYRARISDLADRTVVVLRADNVA